MAVGDALAEWLATLGTREPLLVYLDGRAVGRRFDARCALVARRAALRHADPTRARLRALAQEHAHAGARAQCASACACRSARARSSSGRSTSPRCSSSCASSSITPCRQLRLASVLWQRSRGNPGLLFEILRGLVDRGEAQPLAPGERLVLRITPDELPLPGSLRKAIGESYRRLPAADRQWLRRLAVAGVGTSRRTSWRARFPRCGARRSDEMLARMVRSGWYGVDGRALSLRAARAARGGVPRVVARAAREAPRGRRRARTATVGEDVSPRRRVSRSRSTSVRRVTTRRCSVGWWS
jgi:hypothetical protein